MIPKNHILHMKGFLPKSECEKIIHYFDSNSQLHYKGSTGRQHDDKLKKDTEIFCDMSKSNGPCWILKYLKIASDEYVKRFPHTDKLSRWGLYKHFKIQKYHPSEGYFVTHCENVGPVENESSMEKRLLAWMIYLNNVTDGGHTEFPDQRKKYQPRVGDVLLWPAYFTHPHRGITSKSQTKYIVTGWFNFFSGDEK
tara:strand:- start:62 stop:649 length:588 start_codon:yes stop_codon:yes gene_type:complete